MSAISLDDTNLFAYCRNNPVRYEDTSGEWVTMVIGAVVGGLVNGYIAYKSGASRNEMIVSVVMGTISGALSATGIGGIVGQAIIGASTNMIDTGYSSYLDVKSGEMSVGSAIACTTLSTALGGLFGTAGYEGTASFIKSCAIFEDGMKGLGKMAWSQFSGKTLKTSAKQKVTNAVNKLGTHIMKTTGSTFLETALTTGASTYGVKYTEYWFKYYC